MPLDRFILITGCSGGGKSTLLAELQRRGYAVVPEPGRRIIAAETSAAGPTLPWIDPDAFARRAIDMARTDLVQAERMHGPVFFDRGLIDAHVALKHANGASGYPATLNRSYNSAVFVAPPWPEIFRSDAERRHNFASAESEYHRLSDALGALGYRSVLMPKVSVANRADFVLSTLGFPSIRRT